MTGKRPGRPRTRKGEPPSALPRIMVELDEASGCGAIEYATTHGVSATAGARELLAAWWESPPVRRAVAAWRAGRAT